MLTVSYMLYTSCADSQYLQNFVVTVDANNATNSGAVCGTYINGSVQYGASLLVVCTPPLVGRYVTITRLNMLPQPRSMAISEVQVNGTRINGSLLMIVLFSLLFWKELKKCNKSHIILIYHKP